MLNNITNFFNLIATKKVKTQLDPTDLLAIGTKDPRFSGNYQPTLIEYEVQMVKCYLMIMIQ
jgi:hypothetical protein